MGNSETSNEETWIFWNVLSISQRIIFWFCIKGYDWSLINSLQFHEFIDGVIHL